MQQNKDVFDEMIAQREQHEQKMKAIKLVVEDMIAHNINVDSALQVKFRVSELMKVVVSIDDVKKVMHNDLDMSYTKITKVAIHANSTKNMFLRQRFAIKFLALS